MAPEPAPIDDASPDAAPGTPEEDTDWKAQAEELREKLEANVQSVEDLKAEGEKNIRRMQSSYTSTLNSLSSRSEEEKASLEDRFNADKLSTMEGEEKLRYENTILAEKLELEAGRRVTLQAKAADAAAAASYVQQFVNLGVPAKALNTNGNLQDLADSGWGALEDIRAQERTLSTDQAERLAAIEKQLAEAKIETDPNALAESKGDLTPPTVATHTPGDVKGERSMLEVQKSLENYFGYIPSEEEVYRAVETGQLAANVLPGLDALPKV